MLEYSRVIKVIEAGYVKHPKSTGAFMDISPFSERENKPAAGSRKKGKEEVKQRERKREQKKN